VSTLPSANSSAELRARAISTRVECGKPRVARRSRQKTGGRALTPEARGRLFARD
jgi:hypothetical protein